MRCFSGLTQSELYSIRNVILELIQQNLSPRIIVDNSSIVDILDYYCVDMIQLYFKELSSCICTNKPLQSITAAYIVSKFYSEVLEKK